MKATIRVKNAMGDVIAVVDGKYVYSVEQNYIQLYIPKDELGVGAMRALTRLAMSGGTVSFKPNWDERTVYVSPRKDFFEIEWED